MDCTLGWLFSGASRADDGRTKQHGPSSETTYKMLKRTAPTIAATLAIAAAAATPAIADPAPPPPQKVTHATGGNGVSSNVSLNFSTIKWEYSGQ